MAEKTDRGDDMKPGNIFSEIPDLVKDEIFETLLKTAHLDLERIISSGQATPPGQWYDQPTDEWVILLKGRAGLLFEGQKEVMVLHPGDYVHILAHQRHRVEWTDGEQKTVWLALHYSGSDKIPRSGE
jgi:cupin 2 domain-containing protein